MFEMTFLLLLALVGASYGYSIPQEPRGPPPSPPQSNPRMNTDTHGVNKNPLEPVANIQHPGTSKVRAGTCDLNAIAAASGDRLTTLVRDAPGQCINKIFNIEQSLMRSACNDPDMNTIANAFYQASYSYDPAKPDNTPGILNFILYLRACMYVQGYNEQTVPKFDKNLLPLVRYGIDNFLKRPNLETKNDVHYEIFREAITLISNAHDYLNYASALAAVLTKLNYAWDFKPSDVWQRADQGEVINAIYDNFWRSHLDEEAAKAYYCSNTQVPQALNDFMTRQAGLLNTDNEYVLRNAGGELGRFAKYSCITSTVSGYLRSQLSRFTSSNAPKVWASIADKIAFYDNKNCATYNICTFKEDLERKILSYTKTCDKTYVDVFKVRAQQITDSEASEVCRRLKDQESYFHNLVNDNWKPVNPDTNALIEVVIFDSVDDYKFYASILFGIDTNNGGMYIEGDPSKPGNVARYFCYERPRDGKFDVWNLEHEFTHYLDGRYDMQGDFTDGSSSGHTIWWLEGFAEYAANKNQYPSMVQDCTDKSFSLSTIFNNNYNSGQDRIYHYGYLAARFMFERHRNEVNTILNFFRTGQYSQFESYFRGIGSMYDQEFSSWCTCIANGRPC